MHLKIFILFFSLVNVAISAPLFPRGCEVRGFEYIDNYLVLNDSGEQTLYLMKNIANYEIEIYHQQMQETFLTPKLKNKMLPGNWSAFSSDIPLQYFVCIKTSSYETVSCKENLEVCQYPRVKFALSNMGTYWASQNKPQPQVLKDAISKGILLHW